MSERLMIGAMSGTSADGVDAALVRVSGRGLTMSAELLRHCQRPYSPQLRQMIFAKRSAQPASLRELAELARHISLAYADAVGGVLQAADVTAEDIVAIAAHGQTLFHDPPLTIQWLDPALLAWETKCAVVSDFRRADCAAGGQGAPLVPFADYLLFRDAEVPRVLLNIGGIANVTYLRAGGPLDEVIAFDTGPGNCLSDWLCRSRGTSGQTHDAGGAGALRGRVIESLASHYLQSRYFTDPPPKSTDTAAMIEPFEMAMDPAAPLDDLLATAAFCTAQTIANAVKKLCPEATGELIASGGGVRNAAIMRHLRKLLPGAFAIRWTDDFGIPADAKESIAFALIGAATLDGFPSNVPSVTGARTPAILGSITPAPTRK